VIVAEGARSAEAEQGAPRASYDLRLFRPPPPIKEKNWLTRVYNRRMVMFARRLPVLAFLALMGAFACSSAAAATPTVTRFQIPQFGSYPSGAPSPQTSLVSSAGYLWFVEGAGTLQSGQDGPSYIGRMTPSGQTTLFPVDPSILPNPLSGASQGLFAGSDGNVWITSANQVSRMTPSGQITAFPPTPGYSVDGGVAGASGSFFFSEQPPTDFFGGVYGSERVVRISANGARDEFPITSFGQNWGSWSSAAVGANGTLWFANISADVSSAMVGSLSPDGTVSGFLSAAPNSLASGADGSVWFISSGKISRVAPSGSLTTFPTSVTVPSFTANIAVAKDGAAWVTTTSGIIRITPAGQTTSFRSWSPQNTVAAPDGSLWAAGVNSDNTVPPGNTGGLLRQFSAQGKIAEYDAVVGVKDSPLMLNMGFGGGTDLTVGPDGNIWSASYGDSLARLNLRPNTIGACTLSANSQQKQFLGKGYLSVKVRCNQRASLLLKGVVTIPPTYPKENCHLSSNPCGSIGLNSSRLAIAAQKTATMRVRITYLQLLPMARSFNSRGLRMTASFQLISTVGNADTAVVANIAHLRFN
jgi:hypothetical protein